MRDLKFISIIKLKSNASSNFRAKVSLRREIKLKRREFPAATFYPSVCTYIISMFFTGATNFNNRSFRSSTLYKIRIAEGATFTSTPNRSTTCNLHDLSVYF